MIIKTVEVLNQSVGIYQIRKWILDTLGGEMKLFQSEIVDHCSSAKWGSKPTILKIIQNLLEDNLIEEHRENSKKGSKGGQPRKYYTKFLESRNKQNILRRFNTLVMEHSISDFHLRRLLDQRRKTEESELKEKIWRENKDIFGIAVNFYKNTPIILYPSYLWELFLVTSDNFKAKELAKKSFPAIGFTRSFDEEKYAIFDFEVEKKTLTVYGYSFTTFIEPSKDTHDNISICLILKEPWDENKKLDNIPKEVCRWFRIIRDLIREDKDIIHILEEMDKIRVIFQEL